MYVYCIWLAVKSLILWTQLTLNISATVGLIYMGFALLSQERMHSLDEICLGVSSQNTWLYCGTDSMMPGCQFKAPFHNFFPKHYKCFLIMITRPVSKPLQHDWFWKHVYSISKVIIFFKLILFNCKHIQSSKKTYHVPTHLLSEHQFSTNK